MGNANFLKKGSWNVICDRCGMKFKREKVRLEWDNLLVCKKCYEIRQPQDFIPGYVDKQVVPISRPPPTDVFV
ncbi:MAG: hypothetical protein WC917_00455 [Bacilli bacterium]|jgi:ribosome-binding protein aMBF1 (putative translation factor)